MTGYLKLTVEITPVWSGKDGHDNGIEFMMTDLKLDTTGVQSIGLSDRFQFTRPRGARQHDFKNLIISQETVIICEVNKKNCNIKNLLGEF